MLWFRAPEKVYIKKGCLPVALEELKTVMDKERVFIVTDTFLYKNGYTKVIIDKLDEMNIVHETFFDVAPDPNLACAKEGARLMEKFEPDCIIAVGGGSAMDAAKIMWVMYEYPDANFEDMAMDFMDIRKRVYTFPEMGKKAYFVAIPTSSGTGSEVTPFAIITDAETGVKWPLADYQLLPNMAIVDVDNMMTQPKGLTSASGIDVMTHAIEAFVSIMATDYTDGLAMKAVKLVFENLPSAYENGANDPKAREEMANASCMAGMAFANAFLGVNHSMAHKLGAFHHLPHGVANAVILTEVMRYNAAEVPTKMGTFSQYQYPHALARYAELGRFAGCTGNTDEEVFENFIAKLEDLKEKIGKLKNGGAKLRDGADSLSTGLSQLNDALARMAAANPEGYAALSAQVSRLTEGSKSLSAGISTYTSGVDQACESIDESTSSDGENTDYETKAEELRTLSAKLKAMKTADQQYNNFSGLEDGKTGGVSFIIETGEISADTESN